MISAKSELDNSSLLPMLVASIALHMMILVAVMVRTYMFPEDVHDFESAIRVDLVALPDKQVNLAPPAEKNQPELISSKQIVNEPSPKKKLSPEFKEKNKAQKKALEKLKALQALENISDEVKDEEKSKKKSLIKGNVLSHGEALKGIASSQFLGFVDQIKKHAQSHWSLPEWLADLK